MSDDILSLFEGLTPAQVKELRAKIIPTLRTLREGITNPKGNETMNPKILKAEKHVNQIAKERENYISLEENKIRQSRERGASQKALADMQSGLDDYIQFTAKLYEDAKAELAAARSEAAAAESAERAKIQAAHLAQKESVLKNWLANGGTAENFEAAWPELERKILIEKVMNPEPPKPQNHFQRFSGF